MHFRNRKMSAWKDKPMTEIYAQWPASCKNFPSPIHLMNSRDGNLKPFYDTYTLLYHLLRPCTYIYMPATDLNARRWAMLVHSGVNKYRWRRNVHIQRATPEDTKTKPFVLRGKQIYWTKPSSAKRAPRTRRELVSTSRTLQTVFWMDYSCIFARVKNTQFKHSFADYSYLIYLRVIWIVIVDGKTMMTSDYKMLIKGYVHKYYKF